MSDPTSQEILDLAKPLNDRGWEVEMARMYQSIASNAPGHLGLLPIGTRQIGWVLYADRPPRGDQVAGTVVQVRCGLDLAAGVRELVRRVAAVEVRDA